MVRSRPFYDRCRHMSVEKMTERKRKEAEPHCIKGIMYRYHDGVIKTLTMICTGLLPICQCVIVELYAN